jgi:hypothetical protein
MATRIHHDARGSAMPASARPLSVGDQMEQEQTSQEDQIRTRAYYLWEHAPEPKGTPDEYWEQARSEIEKEAPPVESGPIAEEPKK